MKTKVLGFAAVALVVLVAIGNGQTHSASSSGGERKEIYAHYMGCFPSACRAIPYHQRQCAEKRTLRKSGVGPANIINWPLVPQGKTLSLEENAELEIRQALRAGIDGFAIDAWAGDTNAKVLFETYLRTAERMKVPFKFTICFDPSCHRSVDGATTIDKFVNSAKWVLQFKDSPNIARRDGKVLFFSYYATHVLPAKEQTLEKVADAWRYFREQVGEPIYLHGCMEGAVVGRVMKDRREPRPAGTPSRAFEVGQWAGRTFDVVGGFLGDHGKWCFNEDFIKGVKSVGGQWAQPMIWQYCNKGPLGNIIADRGLDLLRKNWEAAIRQDSPVLQFVTWNDYGEETILAPAYGTHYTLSRVNRHYSDWWKTGREPEVTNDEVHVVHRRYPLSGNAPTLTYPHGARTMKAPDVLDVIVFAKEAGRVVVPGYGAFDVPRGMSNCQFPLKIGAVSAELRRGGVTVAAVKSPEKVSASPWREDYTQFAYGSNYEEEWKKDFGDVPPLRYCEYGDADGDGLPNWFEMCYGGGFPYMDRATQLSPTDDPDGDGRTNLQEWRQRTNPLVAERVCRPGDKWDLVDVSTNRCFFNPIRDKYDEATWRILTQARQKARGDFDFYRLMYFEPRRQYIPFIFTTNNTFVVKRNGEHDMVAAWRCPADGTFGIALELKTANGGGTADLELAKSSPTGLVTLASKTVKAKDAASFNLAGVKLGKGDSIYFMPNFKNVQWQLDLHVSRFEILFVSE